MNAAHVRTNAEIWQACKSSDICLINTTNTFHQTNNGKRPGGMDTHICTRL